MKTIWEILAEGTSSASYVRGMDAHLNGEKFQSLQELTDIKRNKKALQLPVSAGTRVAFIGYLDSYMSYEDPPTNGMTGEVVSAKSANGAVTAHDGRVFVKFEDGKLRSIFAEHLQLSVKKEERKVASFRVASLGDLTNFLKVAEGQLVHKSTKDLWSFHKDADGNITVERLYDDNGEPLKL